MKKNILGLIVGGALLTALSASAYTFEDSDSIGVWLGQETGVWSYSSDFNIAGGDGTGIAGYSQASWTITGAFASFEFYDNYDRFETVTIELGGVDVGTFTSGGPGGVAISWGVGGPIFGSILLDLQADGILAYTVQLNDNPTPGNPGYDKLQLVSAFLGADATANNGTVPEGGATVALLGLGLLGLSGLKRKLVK